MIKSNPFGATILSGEEAEEFIRMVNDDYEVNIDLSRGNKILEQYLRNGFATIEVKDDK